MCVTVCFLTKGERCWLDKKGEGRRGTLFFLEVFVKREKRRKRGFDDITKGEEREKRRIKDRELDQRTIKLV